MLLTNKGKHMKQQNSKKTSNSKSPAKKDKTKKVRKYSPQTTKKLKGGGFRFRPAHHGGWQ